MWDLASLTMICRNANIDIMPYHVVCLLQLLECNLCCIDCSRTAVLHHCAAQISPEGGEVVALEAESCTWEEVCREGIMVAQGWQNQGVGKVGPQLRDNVCLCLQMKRLTI